mmetsp:Transcript_12759/g.20077  ORF Transcript_12759/g.20077 Transcript_12759/m.20077 type:complete len:811 (-) Transcript_12759:264-2696(-)
MHSIWQMSALLVYLCLFVLFSISNGFLEVVLPRVAQAHAGSHVARSACYSQPVWIGSGTRLQRDRWFPSDSIEGLEGANATLDSIKEQLETHSLQLAARLITLRLEREPALSRNADNLNRATSNNSTNVQDGVHPLVHGKFVDLCCTRAGEQTLERLFQHEEAFAHEPFTIMGAIIVLQSVLILGSQCGLTTTPEQFENSISHLKDAEARTNTLDFSAWNKSSARRLKYQNNRTPALQLLGTLKRKRSARGAFDLLVSLGVWQKHEDLALIRSGFSLRFDSAEIEAANKAAATKHDPDSVLGIRRDLLHHKLYTIDSASTSEIDDALSVEKIVGKPGESRVRYWIHIADVERWAPWDSDLFRVAKERGTSLYLPHGSIPMLPARISSEVMSLRAATEACALSLGVELAEDGSILDSSLVLVPSLVRVRYRLTYDEVDEMLDEGLAFNEEWELGALFSAAVLRRELRIKNGSAEGFATQIPQFSMATFPNKKAPDGIGISLNVQVSHNGGRNQSAIAESELSAGPTSTVVTPVSSAATLVTEMMILAGEAIGRWKLQAEKEGLLEKRNRVVNGLRLPFRSQTKPDYRSRLREHSILMDLLSNDVGGGYCHAWYARRFLMPVQIGEEAMPHFGLGIGCYVQWTSPIRRFGDLQVHCSVKHFLRRQKILRLLDTGASIPAGITSADVGCNITHLQDRETTLEPGFPLDADIDYRERAGLVGVARRLQRTSQKYWILEYLRRIKEVEQDTVFQALVLGCTNPSRRQYAIYIYELGLECKYISSVGFLQAGVHIKITVASVLPRNGQVTFIRAAD